jgi:hypothetical protein
MTLYKKVKAFFASKEKLLLENIELNMEMGRMVDRHIDLICKYNGLRKQNEILERKVESLKRQAAKLARGHGFGEN